MPIHAILGATGGAGSAILRCLLSSQIPDLHINILVRSKSKLLQAFPQLELTSSPTITIIEASISNEEALKACIKAASTIYVCVSTNHSTPKVTIAQTTAAHLITALTQLRQDEASAYKPPVVLFNRSLSLNSDIDMPIPTLLKKFFLYAVWPLYADLIPARALYTTAENDKLLILITADGPTLMDSEGTERTGHRLLMEGTTSPWINYADFGAAIVEMGQRSEEFGGKVVGAAATGHVRIVWRANIKIVFLGLWSQFFPF